METVWWLDCSIERWNFGVQTFLISSYEGCLARNLFDEIGSHLTRCICTFDPPLSLRLEICHRGAIKLRVDWEGGCELQRRKIFADLFSVVGSNGLLIRKFLEKSMCLDEVIKAALTSKIWRNNLFYKKREVCSSYLTTMGFWEFLEVEMCLSWAHWTDVWGTYSNWWPPFVIPFLKEINSEHGVLIAWSVGWWPELDSLLGKLSSILGPRKKAYKSLSNYCGSSAWFRKLLLVA